VAGDGNATDIIGGNSTLQGGATFAAVKLQAFSFNGVDGEVACLTIQTEYGSQITIDAWSIEVIWTRTHILQKRSASNVGVTGLRRGSAVWTRQ